MNNKTKGLIQVTGAFFIWSLLGPILNLSTFNSTQTLWATSLLAVIYLLIFAIVKKKLKDLKKISLNFSLVLFLLSSGFSAILWFKGLTLLPIGQAVLLYSSAPIFTLILGLVFLKEKIHMMQIVSILVGILGIGIILSVDFRAISLESSVLIGVVFVLLGAFLTSTQAVISKKYSLQYPLWLTVLLIMTAQLVLGTPFVISHWAISPFAIISVMFISIFSSILAFLWYVNGFVNLRSSTVTLIGYIEPLLAAFWGFLFLSQTITLATFIGGFLILLAGYLIVKSEKATS